MKSEIGPDFKQLIEKLTRDQAAEYYAKFLTAGQAPNFVFEFINLLIIHKWSVPGLTYIKEKAWKIAKEQATSNPVEE